MLQWFGKRLRQMQEVPRDERGFTLIELLVVVIIIGILAAIAIPTFLAQRQNAQEAGCRSDTRNAANAAVSYGANNAGNYSNLTTADLEPNGFRQSAGNTTTVSGTTANSFTLSTACAGGGTVQFNSANGQVSGP